MKTIEELIILFNFFNHSKDRFKTIDKCTNWEIVIFRPFERDDKIIHSFRLYGKVSGSRFKEYNDNLQWYAAVDYSFDLKDGKLYRKAYENELPSFIIKDLKYLEILEAI